MSFNVTITNYCFFCYNSYKTNHNKGQIMNKTLLIAIFPLIFYVGCGDNVENKSVPQKNSEVKSELNVSKKTKPKDLLNQLGLNIENEKISIDFNKSKNFIKKMEIEMHSKADEIQYKIDKADINFSRDIGIDISDDKFEIDLNKTKKMFQQLNILMKDVLLEKNSSKN